MLRTSFIEPMIQDRNGVYCSVKTHEENKLDFLLRASKSNKPTIRDFIDDSLGEALECSTLGLTTIHVKYL